jgi:hypothetical protein
MKNYQFINGPQIQADYFGQRIIFVNELNDFFVNELLEFFGSTNCTN